MLFFLNGDVLLLVLFNLLSFCSIICGYLMSQKIAFHDDAYFFPMVIALIWTVYLRMNTAQQCTDTAKA